MIYLFIYFLLEGVLNSHSFKLRQPLLVTYDWIIIHLEVDLSYLAGLSFFLRTNENGHDDLSKLGSFEKRKLGSQQSFHGWPKATLLHFYKEIWVIETILKKAQLRSPQEK
jgi:hypothetical protein